MLVPLNISLRLHYIDHIEITPTMGRPDPPVEDTALLTSWKNPEHGTGAGKKVVPSVRSV